MLDIKIESDFDFSDLGIDFDEKIDNALYKTAELVFAEEVAKMYFPFKSGDTQNADTAIEAGHGYAAIVSTNPYVRRLYYHPEFNFYKGKNKNAQGLWHENITQDFINKTFDSNLNIGG